MFTWLQKLGQTPADEMTHVFNMGIGLALIVSPFYANTVTEIIQSFGLKSWVIGKAASGSGKSRWK